MATTPSTRSGYQAAASQPVQPAHRRAGENGPLHTGGVEDGDGVGDDLLVGVVVCRRGSVRAAVASRVVGDDPEVLGQVGHLKLPLLRMEDLPRRQEDDRWLAGSEHLVGDLDPRAVDEAVVVRLDVRAWASPSTWPPACSPEVGAVHRCRPGAASAGGASASEGWMRAGGDLSWNALQWCVSDQRRQVDGERTPVESGAGRLPDVLLPLVGRTAELAELGASAGGARHPPAHADRAARRRQDPPGPRRGPRCRGPVRRRRGGSSTCPRSATPISCRTRSPSAGPAGLARRVAHRAPRTRAGRQGAPARGGQLRARARRGTRARRTAAVLPRHCGCSPRAGSGCNLGGEREIPVPPLRLPRSERYGRAGSTGRRPRRRDAGRARPRRPSRLHGDRADAGALVEICRRLDGLPLALELAAARAKLFTLVELADRLRSRMAVLTSNARDAPARHRTLRAALEWSYELLGRPSARCSAGYRSSSGSWTLDAAVRVCGDPDTDLVETVGSLLDKSLVQRPLRPGGRRRVRPAREPARVRRRAAGRAATTASRPAIGTRRTSPSAPRRRRPGIGTPTPRRSGGPGVDRRPRPTSRWRSSTRLADRGHRAALPARRRAGLARLPPRSPRHRAGPVARALEAAGIGTDQPPDDALAAALVVAGVLAWTRRRARTQAPAPAVPRASRSAQRR